MPAETLRVAIVDDHVLFRDALAALLSQGAFQVVAQAGSAREAYPIVETAQPDVILVDLYLPGIGGLHAIPELTRRSPKSKVVILTASADEDAAGDALAAGAAGFVVKTDSASVLIDAIQATVAGRTFVSPSLPPVSAERRRRPQGRPPGPIGRLSTREKEIFELVINGHSNQSISRELCISLKTVETHRAHINRKLKVHSPAELVRLAALEGLIRDPGRMAARAVAAAPDNDNRPPISRAI